MKMNKTHLIVALVMAILGFTAGFFTGKAIYDKPLVESVTMDTTTTIDTIPDIAPTPKDSTPVRTIIRWLPMKLPKKSGAKESVDNPYPASTDTVAQWQYFGIAEQLPQHPQDSALVEIPITSKHYQSPEYDAWVSGYQPSLDSISVYQRTEYITETITQKKPPNKWEFDIIGGINYATSSQHWLPYAGGELMLNRDKRLQMGIDGGVLKEPLAKKWTPFAGAKIRIKVL